MQARRLGRRSGTLSFRSVNPASPSVPFFIITLVMSDFVTVQMMSGGQSASVAVAMNNKRALLQYPAAAADAVVLLGVVLLMVGVLMRLVNVRKEL